MDDSSKLVADFVKLTESFPDDRNTKAFMLNPDNAEFIANAIDELNRIITVTLGSTHLKSEVFLNSYLYPLYEDLTSDYSQYDDDEDFCNNLKSNQNQL